MISRCALPFVLMLGAAPSAAFSQSLVCHPIRDGETATQLARRITGDGRNTYQAWFQIVDASSRFVPKSQYDRLRPGWRACIVREAPEGSVGLDRQREALAVPGDASEPPQSAAAASLGSSRAIAVDVVLVWLADTRRLLADADLTLVWLAAAVILPLVMWRILDDFVARRRAVLIVMKHFAHRFVREFERPLLQQPAERPLMARLRVSPVRGRLDILLAPGQGRRYPNLSDHRRNVEYDVVRILRSLADDSFVRDPIYTKAGWVVVPFRYEVGPKRTGVACISSF